MLESYHIELLKALLQLVNASGKDQLHGLIRQKLHQKKRDQSVES
jgi:hypothetical protein